MGTVSRFQSSEGDGIGVDLIARAQRGDRGAWAVLFDALNGPLLNYLRARGARDPEDLLGEVFLRLARNLVRFDGDFQGLRAYSFTIAQNCLRDAARRSGVRPDTVFLTPEQVDGAALARNTAASAEEEAMSTVALERYRECFADLTADQRHVLYLRVMADLSIEDTAEILGKTPGAVKQMQRRAIDRLRAALGDGAVAAPPPDLERFS